MSDLISRSELLESFRKSYCGPLEMENSDGMMTFRSICRIIKKQPNASDDVCEYKIKDDVIYASCNNKSIASVFCWFNECGDYKYCPYCRKKIKTVEVK